MRGLSNLGNTCYLNAALQCLLFVPPLTNYLVSELPETDEKTDGKSDEKTGEPAARRDLAIAYTDLARTYWTTPLTDPPRPLDTRRLWTALGDAHPAFRDRAPHDAHEALAHVLDSLRTYRVPRAPDGAGGPADRAWAAECRNHSVVSAVFQGQIETRVTATCGFRSVTYEHPVAFELDVRSSLSAGFADLFGSERVEAFALPDGRTTSVTVRRTPTRLPFVLLVHLKRFAPDGSKIDRFVDYSTTLDLSAWGDASAFYDLFAVCFHAGGHYTASCEVGGAWYALDDERVTRLENINDVVHRDAYVLLFKKRAGW